MKKDLLSKRKKRAVFIFIAPLVLVMLVFLAVPIIKAATMSVQYWYMSNPSPKGNYFTGLDNYKNVLKDPFFYNSVKLTFLYIVVTVALRYLIGFGSALLLNYKFGGRGLARSLLIIPWAIPEVIACLIWILMYDKDYGIINSILINMGILSQGLGYLTDPSITLTAAMVVNIWKGFPFVSIMLLAALQSVPNELYEAASIDGAKGWQEVWHITVPSIRSVSKVVFLLLVIWTIKDYAIAYSLARGGPARATEILTIFIQQTAFKYFDFGKAAATGMIMLVLSLLFTSVYFKIVDKEEQYR